MKEIVITTTRLAAQRLEYGVREGGHWLREGIEASWTLDQLTAPQQATLAAAEAVLQAVAEAHAGTLPTGQSVRLELSKPQANLVEYSVVNGGTLVRHGLVCAFDPEALPVPDGLALLEARELLGELAQADAQALNLL